MVLYLTPQAAVGGDPAQLREVASVLTATARQGDELAAGLRHTATGSEEYWQGSAGNAYRRHAESQATALAAVAKALPPAATAYQILADELAAAHERVAAAFDRAAQIGLDRGDLVGRPWAVAAFILREPQHAGTVAGLIGEVVGARLAANGARDAFVASMGNLRTDVAAAGGDDRRAPDERDGRRIRSDEIFRRSEGGDRDGGHFDNDWAGRAILERYLRGGDDWTITDDPEWSDYMMDNQLLREQLTGPAQQQAQAALEDYLDGGGTDGSFRDQFRAEIENGEGIVGYQYLHGTDSTVGGFEYEGDTAVAPRPDGTYEVTLDGRYTWNDRIDPNPQYQTDTWKSRLAEVLTLGQADPYEIHISWGSETTVTLDGEGNVVDIDGYPAP